MFWPAIGSSQFSLFINDDHSIQRGIPHHSLVKWKTGGKKEGKDMKDAETHKTGSRTKTVSKLSKLVKAVTVPL